MKSVRRLYMEQDHGDEKMFRWRGGDVSRIEAISDAMLAFAMTLVVVSLEVPDSWADMKVVLAQLPAFFACFLLIGWIWVIHYYYFRRFGLEDRLTITLNAMLLFSVLAYVFPLKYLATALIGRAIGLADAVRSLPSAETDNTQLMLFYSGGFTVIFVWFTSMYWHAWRRRDELELNPPERAITKAELQSNLALVLIGCASMGLAFFAPPLAGLIFFAIGPVKGILGWRNGVRIEREYEAWRASEAGRAAEQR